RMMARAMHTKPLRSPKARRDTIPFLTRVFGQVRRGLAASLQTRGLGRFAHCPLSRITNLRRMNGTGGVLIRANTGAYMVDGQLILVETDDGARKIPDMSCCGTESSGPRVRCRQARAPART